MDELELEALVFQRALLTQNNIFSNVFTNGERFSFSELTNELIALTQAPLFFGIYRAYKKRKVKSFSLVHCTYRRTTKGDEFVQRIKKMFPRRTVSSKGMILLENISPDENSEYYLMAVRISYKGEIIEPILVNNDSGCNGNRLDNYIWKCLEHICKDSALLRSLTLTSHSKSVFIKNITESMFNSEKDYNLAVQSWPELYNMDPYSIIGLQKGWFGIKVPFYLERAFEKITSTSDFLENSYGDGRFSNYFLMARCSAPVSGSSKRDAYNISLILNQKQQANIKGYLKNLSKNNCHTRPFYDFPTEIGGVENRKKILEELDNWFWSTCNSIDGEEELLKYLVTPISSCSESFADVVFQNGQSFIRYPYSNSGLHRIKNELLPKLTTIAGLQEVDYKLDVALKRAVCYHYVFSALSLFTDRGSKKNESLVMLLSPIEVGGSIWGVVGHIMEVKSKIPLDSQEWFIKFNYLTSVRRKFSRNVRAGIRALHLNELEKIYTSVFVSIMRRPSSKGQQISNMLNELSFQYIQISGLPLISPYSVPVIASEKDVYSSKENQKQHKNQIFPFLDLEFETEEGNLAVIRLYCKFLRSTFLRLYTQPRSYISMRWYQEMSARAWKNASLIITKQKQN